MKIVLASKSERRIDIFRRLQFEFIISPAEIDEDIEYKFPLFLPLKLAEMKAEFSGKNYPDILTVGADTLVFLEGNILGKPKNIREASNFLKMLSDKWHSVVSGVCLIKFSTIEKFTFLEESRVKFKRLNDKIISEYFSKVNPLDKSGGYAIQEYADLIIDKIEGSLENIIGFPTEKFLKILSLIKN